MTRCRGAYTASVILLTVVLMVGYGVVNQRLGAFLQRAQRHTVADSLLAVEMLQHTDSIVDAVARQEVYLFLFRRDSIIRARRAECGPLVVC